MQNFQNSFETRKRSSYSTFSICMTVPLNKAILNCQFEVFAENDWRSFHWKSFFSKMEKLCIQKKWIPEKNLPAKICRVDTRHIFYVKL